MALGNQRRLRLKRKPEDLLRIDGGDNIRFKISNKGHQRLGSSNVNAITESVESAEPSAVGEKPDMGVDTESRQSLKPRAKHTFHAAESGELVDEEELHWTG